MDFAQPAADFFHTPGRDPGLSVVSPPDWMWRSAPRGQIEAFAISDHPEQRAAAERHILNYRRLRQFKAAVEFNTLPVVLEEAAFAQSYVSAKGRWLLNGASGTRLRNRFVWRNDGVEGLDRTVAAHFAQVAAENDGPLPIWGEAAPMDFAVECRNTFNYFHFLTETLGQLCFAPPAGRIFIHSPDSEVRGFVRRFIAAIFPDLADRVIFQPSPARHDRVLTAFNLRHLYNQCGDGMMPSVDGLAPRSWAWKGRSADRGSQAVLAMNGFEASLRRLRETALARIAGMDVSHLPRRFWVARDNSGPRVRRMKGEARLLARLREVGFAQVMFEDMSPLEQVAIMANADIMASYHGAGFANMIFASPQTECIEIGHLQTALCRWSYFMPMAHVSRCRYTSFFADHNVVDPANPPGATDDLAPVAISQAGIDRVMAHVTARLADQDGQFLASAHALSAAADWPGVLRLLETRPQVVGASADLLVQSANAHAGLQDPEGAFLSLAAAFELAPARYHLLERMIPLARRTGRADLWPDLLALHAARFPDRHQGLQTRLPWTRR